MALAAHKTQQTADGGAMDIGTTILTDPNVKPAVAARAKVREVSRATATTPWEFEQAAKA